MSFPELDQRRRECPARTTPTGRKIEPDEFTFKHLRGYFLTTLIQKIATQGDRLGGAFFRRYQCFLAMD
jgi:hypothetical protein